MDSTDGACIMDVDGLSQCVSTVTLLALGRTSSVQRSRSSTEAAAATSWSSRRGAPQPTGPLPPVPPPSCHLRHQWAAAVAEQQAPAICLCIRTVVRTDSRMFCRRTAHCASHCPRENPDNRMIAWEKVGGCRNNSKPVMVMRVQHAIELSMHLHQCHLARLGTPWRQGFPLLAQCSKLRAASWLSSGPSAARKEGLAGSASATAAARSGTLRDTDKLRSSTAWPTQHDPSLQI